MLKLLLEEIREVKKAMATKHDLKKFATKEDLRELKSEIIERIKEEIKESEGFIVGIVDKNKVDKAAFHKLEQRVTRLEHKIAA